LTGQVIHREPSARNSLAVGMTCVSTNSDYLSSNTFLVWTKTPFPPDCGETSSRQK
jgi:hypothetical protein